MSHNLATSWATLTQVARRCFSTGDQNPPPADDEQNAKGMESDIEWTEEGEEDAMEEPEPEQPPKQPLWSETYAAYNSFVTAHEKNGRRQFKSFLVDVNDSVEVCAMELSHQTTLEEAHARSLLKAKR